MVDIDSTIENVIVIGGGPAGLAACVYLARANFKPLLFAGSPPGGQLMLTSEVENYPGFDHILGPELVDKLRKHAQTFGTRIVDQNILKISFSRSQLQVSTVDKTYAAKALLIATGAKALWLNLPSEQRLRGKGVSACATCDGFFFKNKVVAVVGGGDTAMEEALTLTKFATKVYLIHRRDQFRASKIMQKRVLEDPKIKVMWNTVITDVLGGNKVEGLKLNNQLSVVSDQLDTDKPKTENRILKVDGLFLAIGHKPDTDVFRSHLELDSKGYIVTSERFSLELAKFKVSSFAEASKDKQSSKFKTTIENSKLEEMQNKFDLNWVSATSVEGVFAAGDCVDYQFRQAGTAVGMGIAAALEIERYLEIVS